MVFKKFILPSVFLLAGTAWAQAPAIFPGGILNGASFDKTGQPVAPGTLVSIFGTNLVDPGGASVGVTFNSVAAPVTGMFHLDGYDQINAQVPWNVLAVLPPGTAATTDVPVIVTRGGVSSAPFTAEISAAAPGIFTFSSGLGQAIAYGNFDYAIAAPANSGLPFTSHPAKIGDPATLVILATGLGPVDNPVGDGGIPAPGVLSRAVITPAVLVGGVPAQVVFAGLTQYPGVFQVNIIIQPGTPSGDSISLQIQMDGITTRNDATIAVSQ